MSYLNPSVVQPTFHTAIVDERCRDPSSFFVYAFPALADDSKAPDVVTYGNGVVQIYDNPFNDPKFASKQAEWHPRTVGKLVQPTGMTHGAVTSSGYNDVIIGDMIGTSLNAINEDGGRISWFENPGKTRSSQMWMQREIGRNAGNFCVKAGHFTDPFKLQVMSFPFASKNTKVNPNLVDIPVPVVVFTCPDDPKTAHPWPSTIANEGSFYAIKDARVIPSPTYGGLDKLLIGSHEGISLMWYDGTAWVVDRIAPLLRPQSHSPEGILALDYGKVGNDRIAYIAAAECPDFCLTIHVKDTKTHADGTPTLNPWKKLVLDNFNRPEVGRQVGSFHDLICGDFDGDGTDEFIVSIGMGCDHEHEAGGIWYYKPIDLVSGRFAKWRIGNSMSGHGHACVGDFTASCTLDIINMSVTVSTHQAMMELHVNENKRTIHSISATRAHNEVVLHVPERGKVKAFDEVPLLGIGNTNITLVVLPAGHSCTCPPGCGIGIKVLDGSVSWTEKGKRMTRTCVTEQKHQTSALVNPSNALLFADGEDGAMLLMFTPNGAGKHGPYDDMSKIVVRNLLPDYMPEDVRALQFPFIRVDRLDWGKDDIRFKDSEFYNCTGIYIRRNNNADDLIVHMQLWTAGVGVDCGFHNHADKSFCEVHYCLFNGTGNAGMWWAGHDDYPPPEPPAAHLDRSKMHHIRLPNHAEHGPLWDINKDGSPMHRSDGQILYPWHAWLAGEATDLSKNFPGLRQSYDVWMAFEFPSVSIRRLAQKNIAGIKA
ncbi:hypothetical protein CALCODRAFT_277406 [Calocera cornea HHB12733]|uniref:Uncharacterized protein n=1 Tax=Calocera cornea HHB12733 TaxID=1353952 RepID=A0A165JP63_9BASI|nr:hypothetical protein CALCODRAFT_277406 [Calocera cornea HHB12733]